MENLIVLALGTAVLGVFAIYADRHRDDSGPPSLKRTDAARRDQSESLSMTASKVQVDGEAIPSPALQMRGGLPAEWLVSVAEALRWQVGLLREALGIDSPCEPLKDFVCRLSIEESERLLRLVGLITLVHEMVERSGDAKGFCASHWLGDWLQRPCPAYGWKRPLECLGSLEGLQLVEQTLMQMEPGAYS